MHNGISDKLTALSRELRQDVDGCSAAAAAASFGYEEVCGLISAISERVAAAVSKADTALTIEHLDRFAILEARMASSDDVITGLRSLVKNYEANE